MVKHLSWIALLLVAGTALGDTITLKDGRKIDGLLLPREGEAYLRVKVADDQIVTIQPDEVRGIVLNSAPTPTQQADGAWNALDAQAKKSDDLDLIIASHEKYLQSFPDSPKAAAVREALASYQKMKADDWIRFRTTWMPKAQAAVLVRQAAADAEMARDFLTAGKIREALAKAKVALDSDNQNLLALAVAGIASYRQNDMPTAREYFNRAILVQDADPLERNNLGVISFAQGRQAEGLLHFKKALLGALENRQIVDNVAIALAKYAGSKDVAAYKDLMVTYGQAEAKMATTMAEKGLYRFAYTWVNKEQRDRLVAQVQAVRTRMSQMDAQYTASVATLAGVERDIRDNNAAYEAALSDFNYYQGLILAYGSGGVITRTGPVVGNVVGGGGGQVYYVDPSWYLDRDNSWSDLQALSQRRTQLEQQRTSLNVTIRQLKLDAAGVKAEWSKVQPNTEAGSLRILEPGEVEKPPVPAPYDPPA
jgi:Flp pilus assembly protein TadD